ncbi:MAG TPA: SGNH/GDSL hydrolase family protein [Polyangiaceae bacterium]|jgi:hypothetical protein|nr:SGNH/GDSL hydrolase family protein [Polyangiaceae bacterium]
MNKELEQRADAVEGKLVLAAAVVRHRFERHRADLLLAVGGVLLALLVGEAMLRAYYSVRTERELSRMKQSDAPEHIDTAAGHLAPGVRLSALPGVLYELRPDLRGTYDGHRYRSDRHGFREDRDVAVVKPPGVKRLLGIGDSWMWGMGVDNGETYLDRLGETLDGVDIVNTAVWGYDVEQEVATLRFKGLAFRPDVVVVGLCGNDREYPTFLSRQLFTGAGHSYLWRELATRFFDGAQAAPLEQMPFAAFLAAYAELAELSRANDFEVVVFSECFGVADPRRMHPSCRLGHAAEWRQFLEKLDAWGFHRCPWNIDAIPQNAPPVGHATADGNRALASVIAACVAPLLR